MEENLLKLIEKERTFLKNVVYKFDFELIPLDTQDLFYELEIKTQDDHSLVKEELKIAGCIDSPYKKGSLIKSLLDNKSMELPGIGIMKTKEPQMIHYHLNK